MGEAKKQYTIGFHSNPQLAGWHEDSNLVPMNGSATTITFCFCGKENPQRPKRSLWEKETIFGFPNCNFIERAGSVAEMYAHSPVSCRVLAQL